MFFFLSLFLFFQYSNNFVVVATASPFLEFNIIAYK